MTDGFMAYIMFDNNLITGIAEKTKARSDISKFGTIVATIWLLFVIHVHQNYESWYVNFNYTIWGM